MIGWRLSISIGGSTSSHPTGATENLPETACRRQCCHPVAPGLSRIALYIRTTYPLSRSRIIRADNLPLAAITTGGLALRAVRCIKTAVSTNIDRQHLQPTCLKAAHGQTVTHVLPATASPHPWTRTTHLYISSRARGIAILNKSPGVN